MTSLLAARPLISVYNEKNEKTESTVKLPGVFKCPIRPDLICKTSQQMRMNSRQPYAVNKYAGHQTSAESWGTGRAVARIPRVRGGGTHRSGQGAFGNMCRGGRMFAPTKIWRRWHRLINTKVKRYALSSAIACSGIPALVMAKGHSIEGVPEIPFVVSDSIQSFKKTKEAVSFLRKSAAWLDVERVLKKKKKRAGKGKNRTSRFKSKRGPLLVFAKDEGCVKAFDNIPGVSSLCVDALNLLWVAPGGQGGRFIIWTESAFRKLDAIYGSIEERPTLKSNWNIPSPMMANTDLARIINSEEIQKVLKPKKTGTEKKKRKVNALKNIKAMLRLNPYYAVEKKVREEEKKARIAKDKEEKAKK